MQPELISSQFPLRPLTIDIHHYPVKTGQIYSFGSAVGGELGLGQYTSERRKPGLVKYLDEVSQIECGGQHAVAIKNGSLYSWGVNDLGALGRITDDDVDGIEGFIPHVVDLGPDAFVVQVHFYSLIFYSAGFSMYMNLFVLSYFQGVLKSICSTICSCFN